jgi:hypothetical protein
MIYLFLKIILSINQVIKFALNFILLLRNLFMEVGLIYSNYLKVFINHNQFNIFLIFTLRALFTPYSKFANFFSTIEIFFGLQFLSHILSFC